MINSVLHKISGKSRFNTEFLDDPATTFEDVDWDSQSGNVNAVKEILYPYYNSDEDLNEFYAFTYAAYLDQFPEIEKLIDSDPFNKTYKIGNSRSIPAMYGYDKIDAQALIAKLLNSSEFLALLDESDLSTAFYYAVTNEEKLAVALAVFVESIDYN